ncbi:unnamed protein product [Dracunculus medinensis]|uniref:Fucosyltransferase n=1 Tax=Dracunculus medinensis TaxID=318479 RepID=A0A158Q6H4_DRAME|nr:unnamed protein product [Dracunculus medinensis]
MLNHTILDWTTMFNRSLNKMIKEALQHCSYKCDIITSRSDILKAGAVIFHSTDVKLYDLPEERQRLHNQVYVFLNRESPHHVSIAIAMLTPKFFNLTMTYRVDSDFYYGYGRLQRITKLSDPKKIWTWEKVQRIIKMKTKSVLQFVSHCSTPSLREVYVEELKNYINVTVFGSCNSNPCRNKCEENAIAEHRFYLAFENSVCRDYATEKLFDRMAQLLIPIVLKKSIYRHFLPDGSYIAADDFSSPKALADYLSIVEKNITEYMKIGNNFRYFEWTQNYITSTIGSYGLPAINSMCELCKLLHKGMRQSRAVDFGDWWYAQGMCQQDYAHLLINGFHE